jgi:hypothetical protein
MEWIWLDAFSQVYSEKWEQKCKAKGLKKLSIFPEVCLKLETCFKGTCGC